MTRNHELCIGLLWIFTPSLFHRPSLPWINRMTGLQCPPPRLVLSPPPEVDRGWGHLHASDEDGLGEEEVELEEVGVAAEVHPAPHSGPPVAVPHPELVPGGRWGRGEGGGGQANSEGRGYPPANSFPVGGGGEGGGGAWGGGTGVLK